MPNKVLWFVGAVGLMTMTWQWPSHARARPYRWIRGPRVPGLWVLGSLRQWPGQAHAQVMVILIEPGGDNIANFIICIIEKAIVQ